MKHCPEFYRDCIDASGESVTFEDEQSCKMPMMIIITIMLIMSVFSFRVETQPPTQVEAHQIVELQTFRFAPCKFSRDPACWRAEVQ